MAAPSAPATAPKVAVAVDASPASRHAAAWAAAAGLLSRPGAELHLISVVPTPPLPSPPMRPTFTPGPLLPPAAAGMAAAGMEEYMKRVDKEMGAHRKLLEELHAALAQQVPQLCVQHAVIEGDGAGGAAVGAALVSYCKSAGVDHLVLGSRGLGAFKRAVLAAIGLGSVSDFVLHHAPCAVTVVPSPPAGAAAAH